MAKTSSVKKNNRRIAMAKQYAGKRAKLKAMAVDNKLSRLALRELASSGALPGVVMSSW